LILFLRRWCISSDQPRVLVQQLFEVLV
jgi:hypothetical protein